jgi:3-oxoacyl-[acyl-carrier protein] reductase
MKRAIVVGASRGIGLQVTISLLKDGYEVYALSSNIEKLSLQTSQLSETKAGNLHPIQCDLGAVTDRASAIRTLRSSGGFSHLVFISGLPYGGRLGMILPEDVRRVFEVNTLAFIELLQGLIRSFDRPASVVVVSSTAASYSQVGNSVYGASKIALERMVASFALEFRGKGIRFNCVAPALVDTDMLEMMGGQAREETLQAVNSERALTTQEVSDVVRFLLSSDSLAINGEVVDLGHNLPLTS